MIGLTTARPIVCIEQRLSAHARRLQDGTQSRSRISARRLRSARHHRRDDERFDRRHDVLGRQPRVPISVLLPAQGQRIPRRRVRRCRIAVGLQGGNHVAGNRGNQRQHQSAPAATLSFANAACNIADSPAVRMSVGASIIWDSPFGPLRFDFAYPIPEAGYDALNGSPSAAERSSDRGRSSRRGRVMPDFFSQTAN